MMKGRRMAARTNNGLEKEKKMRKKEEKRTKKKPERTGSSTKYLT